MPENAIATGSCVSPVEVVAGAPPRLRDFYIDRLRSVMTAFVILHLTAITYGAIGGWFWYELKPSSAPSSQILIQFCTIFLPARKRLARFRAGAFGF